MLVGTDVSVGMRVGLLVGTPVAVEMAVAVLAELVGVSVGPCAWSQD